MTDVRKSTFLDTEEKKLYGETSADQVFLENGENLEDSTNTMKKDIEANKLILKNKANSSDVYDKNKVDELFTKSALKDKTYTKDEINAMLKSKVGMNDVYTKIETDDLLETKVDDSDYLENKEEVSTDITNIKKKLKEVEDLANENHTGAKGDKGDDGRPGTSYRFRDEWNVNTEYIFDNLYVDVVTYNGSSYVCKATHKGQVPSLISNYWGLFTQKGDKGDTGLKGDKGDQGLKGDKGDTGVKFNLAGEWAECTEYVNNEVQIDVVTHKGSSYAAIKTNTDMPPGDSYYKGFWQLIAKKGDNGEGGGGEDPGPTPVVSEDVDPLCMGLLKGSGAMEPEIEYFSLRPSNDWGVANIYYGGMDYDSDLRTKDAWFETLNIKQGREEVQMPYMANHNLYTYSRTKLYKNYTDGTTNILGGRLMCRTQELNYMRAEANAPNDTTLPETIFKPNKRDYGGGCVGPDDKIYFSPYNKTTITVFDPLTKTFEEKGSGITGKYGSCAPGVVGKRIYFIPTNNSKIMVYDIDEDKITYLDLVDQNSKPLNLTGEWLWKGCVEVGGYIIAAGFNHNRFIRIDTNRPGTAPIRISDNFGSLPTGPELWCDVVSYGNYVYGVPYKARQIAKLPKINVNTNLTNVEFIGPMLSETTANGHYISAAVWNHLIYFFPSDDTKVMVLDPADDSVTYIDFDSSINMPTKFGPANVDEKLGYVYALENYSGFMLKINTSVKPGKTKTPASYLLSGDKNFSTSTDVWKHAALLKHPNGYFYTIPYDFQSFLRFKPGDKRNLETQGATYSTVAKVNGEVIAKLPLYAAPFGDETFDCQVIEGNYKGEWNNEMYTKGPRVGKGKLTFKTNGDIVCDYTASGFDYIYGVYMPRVKFYSGRTPRTNMMSYTTLGGWAEQACWGDTHYPSLFYNSMCGGWYLRSIPNFDYSDNKPPQSGHNRNRIDIIYTNVYGEPMQRKRVEFPIDSGIVPENYQYVSAYAKNVLEPIPLFFTIPELLQLPNGVFDYIPPDTTPDTKTSASLSLIYLDDATSNTYMYGNAITKSFGGSYKRRYYSVDTMTYGDSNYTVLAYLDVFDETFNIRAFWGYAGNFYKTDFDNDDLGTLVLKYPKDVNFQLESVKIEGAGGGDSALVTACFVVNEHQTMRIPFVITPTADRKDAKVILKDCTDPNKSVAAPLTPTNKIGSPLGLNDFFMGYGTIRGNQYYINKYETLDPTDRPKSYRSQRPAIGTKYIRLWTTNTKPSTAVYIIKQKCMKADHPHVSLLENARFLACRSATVLYGSSRIDKFYLYFEDNYGGVFSYCMDYDQIMQIAPSSPLKAIQFPPPWEYEKTNIGYCVQKDAGSMRMATFILQ